MQCFFEGTQENTRTHTHALQFFFAEIICFFEIKVSYTVFLLTNYDMDCFCKTTLFEARKILLFGIISCKNYFKAQRCFTINSVTSICQNKYVFGYPIPRMCAESQNIYNWNRKTREFRKVFNSPNCIILVIFFFKLRRS